MTKLGISSDVEINPENIVDGSHKAGLDYVPFDGYIAEPVSYTHLYRLYRKFGWYLFRIWSLQRIFTR